MAKYRTMAVFTAQFQLIPNCTPPQKQNSMLHDKHPCTIHCNAIVIQLIRRKKKFRLLKDKKKIGLRIKQKKILYNDDDDDKHKHLI
jgi:hypothetical protein